VSGAHPFAPGRHTWADGETCPLCTIVRSVAFDSVSPPPARAATSIWRMSTAKSLPRLASAAPFLCLIECHFE